MKLSQVTLAFATLALGIASAATTYKVNLPQSTWVGGTELKAGEYKVEVQGGQAIFKGEKQTAQAPAVEEKNDKKYAYTTLEAKDSKLNEVHFGGTNVKLVLKGGAASEEAGSK
ncbi:MAG: hypothetical protein JO307_04055 [Bryobacterales bacterium]|nr:hypothetical protein [Bryobacterales bacterium]MBV9397867.1 hypothetical protein [Bryobacterales bacterium]